MLGRSMKKMKFTAMLMATRVAAIMPEVAGAAVMVVDEATFPNSDFSNDTSSPTLLPVGVDGVTGMIDDGLDHSNSSPQKGDAFTFIGLPTGVQTFDFSIIEDAGTALFFLDIREGGDPFFTNIAVNFSGGFAGSVMTSAAFDGTLDVFFGLENGLDTASYSFTLRTSEVPLPAGAWLFASGLAALGATRKRRKAKRRA